MLFKLANALTSLIGLINKIMAKKLEIFMIIY